MAGYYEINCTYATSAVKGPSTWTAFAAISVAVCEAAQIPLPKDPASSPQTPDAEVTIRIDTTARRQVMEGFGATTLSLTFGDGTIDNVPPALRTKALDAIYNQVKLTLGNVLLGYNHDPRRFNRSGFEIDSVRVIRDKLVAPASAFGADGLFPSSNVDLRHKKGLQDLRRIDYPRYLDACAELVLAGVKQWRWCS